MIIRVEKKNIYDYSCLFMIIRVEKKEFMIIRVENQRKTWFKRSWNASDFRCSMPLL